MRGRNLTKPFSIGGFILGEIYLVIAALAPYHTGAEISTAGKLSRIAGGFFFFGPFGAAAGLGIGLLIGALLKPRP